MTISQTGQTSIIAANNLDILFDDLLVGYSDSDLNGTNQLSVANVSINGQPLSVQTIQVDENNIPIGYILNQNLSAESASAGDILTYDIVGADGEILSVTRTLDAPEQTISQDIFDSGVGGTFPNPLDPGQNVLSGITQPLNGLVVSTDGTTPQFLYNGYELVEVTSLNGELVATPDSGGNLQYQYTSNEGFSGADQLTFTFRSPDGTLYTERRSIEVLENNTTIQKAGTLAEIDANVDPTSSVFTFYATEDGFQSYNSGNIGLNDNRDWTSGDDSFLGELYNSTSDDGTGDIISLLNVAPYDSTSPLTFSSQDVLKYYQKDGATLSLENVKVEFSTNLGNVTVDAVYDSATDTFTAASVPEGTFGAFFSLTYEVSDGSGVNLKGQQISGDGIAPPEPNEVINDTIVLSENLGDATAVVETFDVNDGSVVSTEPLEAGEVIPQPADAEIIIDNFLADATSGDTNYTITKAELEGLFTDLDGDAIAADQFLFATAVDQASDTFVDVPVNYDAASETYSLDTTAFTDAGFDSFRFVANVQGGTDDSVQAVLKVDIASGSVVEKGVEGVDFLYANALPENRDNNAIKKRGEDSITGHYWVNNRDSSLDETFVDGGEYAVIMGRRGELTADITGQEIVDGLVSGDFVATKSFTSYGGYAVNAAFEDGAIDSLVQSTGGEFNQLMVGRIDAESGELVGSLKRISGTEVWDNFNPSNSLSGSNDNAYGDILAQQNEQTGGF